MAFEKLAKTLPSWGSLGLKGGHSMYSPRQETGESLAFGVQRIAGRLQPFCLCAEGGRWRAEGGAVMVGT